MKIIFKLAILFTCFNAVTSTINAQADSIAAFEKAISNTKDDAVKQYYYGKLLNISYYQPANYANYYIEFLSSSTSNNGKGHLSFYAAILQDFPDSIATIHKIFEKKYEQFKNKNDEARAIACLYGLTQTTDDVKIIQQCLAKLKDYINSGKLNAQKLQIEKNNLLHADIKLKTYSRISPNITILLYKQLEQQFTSQNTCMCQLVDLYRSIADNYNSLSKPDSAALYYEKVFSYYIENNAYIGDILDVANSMFLSYGQATQLDKCKKISQYLIENIEKVNDLKFLSARLYNNLSLYYMTVEVSGKDCSKIQAKYCLDKASENLQQYSGYELNKQRVQLDIYHYLAEWGKIFKEYQIAYEAMNKVFYLSDSLSNLKSIKAYEEMQTKYDVAQKDKDLLLAQQKTKLQTTWFVVVVLVLLVIAFGVFYYQKNRNKINQLEQMLKVRNTIAANLHDEVGSTLGSVAIMSRIAQGKDQDEKNSMLSTISGNAQNMLDSMRDIVWSINPENDKLENLLSRMKIFAAETLEKQDIEVVFNVDAKPQGIVIPIEKRKDIYLIYKEAITNAAKYSKAKNVNVEIAESNKKLTISVKDDGIGFINNSAESLGGNGLKNIQKRAEHIGGIIEIKSLESHGTKITLTIQL